MKIHEYQAAEMLRKAGLPVPPGRRVSSWPEARAAAEQMEYPLVVKAQVLVGGRGKAGGVRVVQDAGLLGDAFNAIMGLDISGQTVRQVLLVPALRIEREMYLAVTVDPARSDVVVLFSRAGGVDIEQLAQARPGEIRRWHLNGARTLSPQQRNQLGQDIPDADEARRVLDVAEKLIGVFFAHDCSLAEINPLVFDADGVLWAADAKINFDDNALPRHPDLAALQDPADTDADEQEATACRLSFVKMTGEVGCIVNGAGLAMATMDMIQLCGGRPANFLDVGGSSSPQKMVDALRIVTRNTLLKVILINIFGGITRCDDIARGLIEARRQMTLSVPLVIRLAGTNEHQAKALLLPEGITVHTQMRAAVQAAVALAGGQA